MKDLQLFDIETGALPKERLKGMMPEFSAARNLKDPAKIAANIAEKEGAWLEDAALSPLKGQIVSISYQVAGKPETFRSVGCGGESEGDILTDFIAEYSAAGGGSRYKLCGWNIKSFDLPFIVKRCWANGIEAPSSLTPTGTVRYYWPPMFVDLREVWACGESRPSGSLEAVGLAFGIGGKLGHGKDFARLYADPETREEAIEYQRSEMRICDELCRRFGLID